jgi:hypothetical protein
VQIFQMLTPGLLERGLAVEPAFLNSNFSAEEQTRHLFKMKTISDIKQLELITRHASFPLIQTGPSCPVPFNFLFLTSLLIGRILKRRRASYGASSGTRTLFSFPSLISVSFFFFFLTFPCQCVLILVYVKV